MSGSKLKGDLQVTVIGAGKMGLPLACQMASLGAAVTACDTNAAVVASINKGICPFDEPGLSELIQRLVQEGRLAASTDTAAAVKQSEAIVVIVPVLLTEDRDADLSTAKTVASQIGEHLRRGALVSFEMTMPIGSTRQLVPLLEKGGLKAGRDFNLAYSPERVKSQHVLERLAQTPKVVGGLTLQCVERAEQFYQRYLGAPVINVETLEAAELVKLAGMLYRDVNIALANELARYAELHAINVLPAIAAANTDGEAAILSPGIGVGGHCTPVYPHFVISDARRRNLPLAVIGAARKTNDDQPRFVVETLARDFQNLASSTVLILGLAFRPQVKESLLSPAFAIKDELERLGARVLLHDPLYARHEIESYGLTSGELYNGANPDVLILNTGHEAYSKLDLKQLAARGVKMLVDGRNFFSPEQVQKAGITYRGIGQAHARHS
jgi:nucleotide sugar dehydrogenase